MNSLEDFVHIALYIVMFGVAVTLLFIMFNLTQNKQASVLKDTKERASVTSETYHEDGGQSHMREEQLRIKGTSVFSNIQSLAELKQNRPKVYIKGTEISQDDLNDIKKGNIDKIKAVQGNINVNVDYTAKYTYEFNKTINDYVLTKVNFVR